MIIFTGFKQYKNVLQMSDKFLQIYTALPTSMSDIDTLTSITDSTSGSEMSW